MLERLKTVTLVLLLLSAVCLLVISLTMGVQGTEFDLMDTLRGWLPQKNQPVSQSVAADTAVFPRKIGVAGENGLYTPLNEEEYTSLLSQVSPVFQEAVGSAGEMRAAEARQVLPLLERNVIYFCYDTPVPFYLLQAWTGSQRVSSYDLLVQSAAAVLLEQQVCLAVCTPGGMYYLFDTAADADMLKTTCAALQQSNAVFAFQRSDCAALMGDEIVATAGASYPVYTLQAPAYVAGGELPREVLQSFALNPYLTKVYTDASGALVYVEGFHMLLVQENGDLSFETTMDEAGIDLALPAAASSRQESIYVCQAVHTVMDAVWSAAGASGRLSLEQITAGETAGSYTLSFRAHTGGLFWEDTTAGRAHVTVEGGVITSVTMSPRQLQQQETAAVIPYLQSVAALPQDVRQARLCPRYLWKNELLTPAMCRVREEAANGVG